MSSPAFVLTAEVIRPEYRSGESFRHIVICDGIVRGLANTAAEAAAVAGPSALWADLGPASVGPGFIDTHIHAAGAAEDVRRPSLRDAATLDAVLAVLSEAARDRGPAEWTVTSRNWHESQLREGRLPTTAELDTLGTRGPILLRRGSHLAVLNSRAATLLNVCDGRQPAGAAGQVTADSVITRALGLAGKPTVAQRCEDLSAVMARLAARGITSIREAGVDAAELELFRSLRDQGRLSLRCDLLWRVAEGSDSGAARRQIAGLPPAIAAADDPFLRLTGVKAFVDGRIGDAAVGEHAPHGALRMSPGQLWDIVRESLRQSAGVGCHAVGDAAVRMVLDAYERALSAGLAPEPGHLVVEHALDCAPATIGRLADSGVGVSVHPSIVYEFSRDIRRHWGAGPAARAAPVRDMIAAGVRVAAGSDGDVPPFDPLRGIWFMVTREDRSGQPIGQGQALNRATALDLYTRRAAILLGVPARRGALWPGMDADLAVFSADPLTCPVHQLPDIQILLTLVDGRSVHDPAGLMAKARPR